MSAVVIYTKTFCSFCRRAKELLEMKGVPYLEIDLMKEDKYHEMVDKAGGRKTVPQIFINGSHIGGYDELLALDIRGELDRLLKN